MGYTEQYGKTLLKCGLLNFWNQFEVLGDMKNWDFIGLYGWNDQVMRGGRRSIRET